MQGTKASKSNKLVFYGLSRKKEFEFQSIHVFPITNLWHLVKKHNEICLFTPLISFVLCSCHVDGQCLEMPNTFFTPTSEFRRIFNLLQPQIKMKRNTLKCFISEIREMSRANISLIELFNLFVARNGLTISTFARLFADNWTRISH